jgi:hypothetical protein
MNQDKFSDRRFDHQDNLFDQPEAVIIPPVLTRKRDVSCGNPTHPNLLAEHNRMMNQRETDRRNKRLGPPTGKRSIESRFDEFHRDNPHVCRRLVQLALTMRNKGVTRYGIQGLIEVVRYEEALSTTGDDGFKINNDFGSRYARLIMREIPDLDGFFETRSLKSL